MIAWTYIGHCLDSQPFAIEGVNVWKHQWHRRRGETAVVDDPQYGQTFEFSVYEIVTPKKRIVFAAGEFSNCIWGFYRPATQS
jgi:hypothetical protein